MADDQALQGQPSHLANGSRGRSQLLPYQPDGFTIISGILGYFLGKLLPVPVFTSAAP